VRSGSPFAWSSAAAGDDVLPGALVPDSPSPASMSASLRTLRRSPTSEARSPCCERSQRRTAPVGPSSSGRPSRRIHPGRSWSVAWPRGKHFRDRSRVHHSRTGRQPRYSAGHGGPCRPDHGVEQDQQHGCPVVRVGTVGDPGAVRRDSRDCRELHQVYEWMFDTARRSRRTGGTGPWACSGTSLDR